MALDGDRVVVGTAAGWTAVPLSGGPGEPLAVPRLGNRDQVFAVRLDGQRALWTTHFGELILADPDGTIEHSTDIGVGGPNVAAFAADHSVVAMGGDGLLRSYSPTLQLLRTTYFGAGAFSIHPTPDGRLFVIGLNDFSVWAVDASTLQALGQVQTRSPDIRLVVPSADGSTVVRLYPAGDDPVSSPANIETQRLKTNP
jgi:hypothetical protein